MKNHLFAVILLLAACYYVNAQSGQRPFTFGIIGGFNHTVINGYQSDGERTGFIGSTIYGSLFVERNIGEHNFFGAGCTFSWVNDWSFLEIPLYYRQMLGRQLSVFAGLKLDLAADKFDRSKESTSKFIGLAAWGGARFNISRHFFAEASYAVGISRSFDDAYFDINDGRRNDFRAGIGFHY